jgi:hypothetical protein
LSQHRSVVTDAEYRQLTSTLRSSSLSDAINECEFAFHSQTEENNGTNGNHGSHGMGFGMETSASSAITRTLNDDSFFHIFTLAAAIILHVLSVLSVSQ